MRFYAVLVPFRCLLAIFREFKQFLGKRTVTESPEFKIGKGICININEETRDRICLLKNYEKIFVYKHAQQSVPGEAPGIPPRLRKIY
jgi:hypothetical protein